MRKVDRAKYDEKRQHILEAAEGCFQRDGFRGASISDICAAAGMSPGHLYHYFDSKEAIIEAIFESRLEREAAIVGELTLDTKCRSNYRHLRVVGRAGEGRPGPRHFAWSRDESRKYP